MFLGLALVALALLAFAAIKIVPEYDDCRAAARATGRPVKEVYARIQRRAEDVSVRPCSSGRREADEPGRFKGR